MPATAAVASYGTTLKWDAVLIAEITDISGPGIKVDTIDVTSYSSPSAFKEFIAGFGDGGEVSIEANFISGDTLGQIAFITDAFAKSVKEVIITYPAAAAVSWTFNALVTSIEFKEPLEEQLGFTATLKISGIPVMGVTASVGITAMTGIEKTGTAALVFNPPFLAGTLLYVCTPINTASDWVKLTLTAAGVITVDALGITYPATTTVLTGAITIGAAGTVTPLTIKVQETGKVAQYTTIYIARP
jgi:predicted secreted protein